jgi:diguanylate cyclase (GGDEF)-like protein
MPKTVPQQVHSRVLIIDDDPDIHRLVNTFLSPSGIEIISKFDGKQVAQLIRQKKPNLILLDYQMPEVDGLQVLESIRADGSFDSIPVVFLTADGSASLLTRCFEAGAVDYIRKPFCRAELVARVRAVLERQHLLNHLEYQALHDPLTGLANRDSISDRIQEIIDSGDPTLAAVLYLDFDNFKVVNDSLGHNAGDLLLKQIGDRLKMIVRVQDSVGSLSQSCTASRLGGDEFVVVMENLPNPEKASAIANRLLSVLGGKYFLNSHHTSSSVSIGAVVGLERYRTAEEALRDADTAMYAAKSNGRSSFVVFDPAMHDLAKRRLAVENGLRRAIKDHELVLFYQPIIALDSGRINGLEALIRWQHPEHGLLTPDRFLDVAEQAGLMCEIGRWVLNEASEQVVRWQKKLGDVAQVDIHVNLSRKQLANRQIITEVKQALSLHRLNPKCLHLEVTETEIMDDMQGASEILGELRKLGVQIDLDDFGTGQSSLACLHRLPIDVVKIDRSFVANLFDNQNCTLLVSAMISFANALGMKTVAEGIETSAQLEAIQAMGSTYGQGYFFAKPMTAADVEKLLTASKTFPASVGLSSIELPTTPIRLCN